MGRKEKIIKDIRKGFWDLDEITIYLLREIDVTPSEVCDITGLARATVDEKYA